MTKHLIMMIGLPRSGKSTEAMRYSDNMNAPIVNPDSIRLAVHGQRFWRPGEPMVWTIAKIMIKSLFEAGHEAVILDSTNLSAKGRKEWESFADNTTYIYVNTDVETCKARARKHGQGDLLPVIDRFAGELELPESYIEVDGSLVETENSFLHLQRMFIAMPFLPRGDNGGTNQL